MEPTVKGISMKEQGDESSVLKHIQRVVVEEQRLPAATFRDRRGR
jgi:hypothetical protein